METNQMRPPQIFRVFVASPGDVADERRALKTVIEEINLTNGLRDNFRLDLVGWETHVYPEIGPEAQDSIDAQIGDYDIFIGILWNRFGTPTSKAESGTKQEFDNAYAAWKQKRVKHIAFYFNVEPERLPLESIEQYKKVMAFRSELMPTHGLVGEYSGSRAFAEKIRVDLSRVIYAKLLPPKTAGQPKSHIESSPTVSASKFVVGVDIGTTKIATSLVDISRIEQAAIKKVDISPLPFGAIGNPELVLTKACEAIQKQVAKCDIGWDNISGIGVGLPGQVDTKTGTLSFAPGLKIQDVAVRKRLREHFRDVVEHPIDVRLDNDARCAARCEFYAGLGKETNPPLRNFVVIFIGRGVGSGIVIDGKVYYGAKSSAGEIGHMSISDVGPPCNCGAIGCLETFVTGPAIVRIAKERALAYSRRNKGSCLIDYGDKLTEYDVAEALKQKDEAAAEVAGEVGLLLGKGIANYANLLNPELVILGGGITVGFYDYLIPHIRAGFDAQALKGLRHLGIVQSEFERYAPVIGAALLFHSQEENQVRTRSAHNEDIASEFHEADCDVLNDWGVKLQS